MGAGKYNSDGANVFESFQPLISGEAIPKDAYKGDAEYQKYTNDFAINGKSISTSLYKNDGEDITGYEIGSVARCGSERIICDGNNWNAKIYLDDDKSLVIERTGGASHDKVIKTVDQLKAYGGGPNGITRLGILLVGGGGAAGKKNKYYYKKDKKGGDYWLCGGPGGGGGSIWGVLNLEKATKDKPYYITGFTTYANTFNEAGQTAYLRYASSSGSTRISRSSDTAGIVAYAEGGKAGTQGSRDYAVAGGKGGTTWSCDVYAFFEESDHLNGCDGASYNYASMNSEWTGDMITTPANYKIIQLAKDNSSIIEINNGQVLGWGTKENDGDSIRLPGGNSYGPAGTPSSSGTAGIGAGGGGSCKEQESISTFENGGRGYWALFY